MEITKAKGNWMGALVCAGLMGYALYAQYGLELEPCNLCVFQRLAVIAMGIVFLLAALHRPAVVGARIYAGLLALAAGGGALVAGRHAWLQNLPADEVPECGPGLEYLLEAFSLGEALSKVFAGSGQCAEVVWSFLGLSMPMWVLIMVTLTGGLGIWWNWRR
ncbi:MAG: disulfide bond formation protein B [Gammaproteobacteria bacterium]|nr:disulfide bond formation protein B [Gammaproteobacteria bacterium]